MTSLPPPTPPQHHSTRKSTTTTSPSSSLPPPPQPQTPTLTPTPTASQSQVPRLTFASVVRVRPFLPNELDLIGGADGLNAGNGGGDGGERLAIITYNDDNDDDDDNNDDTNDNEKDGDKPMKLTVVTKRNTPSTELHAHAHTDDKDNDTEDFHFDTVLPLTSTQATLFDVIVRPLLHSSTDTTTNTNANTTSIILSFGTSNSGKSHTLLGSSWDTLTASSPSHATSPPCKDAGVIPSLLSGMFSDVKLAYLSVGVVEVYNEMYYDLSSSDSSAHTHTTGTSYTPQACDLPKITNLADAYRILKSSLAKSKVSETQTNASSSRGHLCVTVTGYYHSTSTTHTSTLNLTSTSPHAKHIIKAQPILILDLAGLERTKKSGVRGSRMKETQAINTSLMSLNKCLRVLKGNDDIERGNLRVKEVYDRRVGEFEGSLKLVSSSSSSSISNSGVNDGDPSGVKLSIQTKDKDKDRDEAIKPPVYKHKRLVPYRESKLTMLLSGIFTNASSTSTSNEDAHTHQDAHTHSTHSTHSTLSNSDTNDYSHLPIKSHPSTCTKVTIMLSVYPGVKDLDEKVRLLRDVEGLRGLSVSSAVSCTSADGGVGKEKKEVVYGKDGRRVSKVTATVGGSSKEDEPSTSKKRNEGVNVNANEGDDATHAKTLTPIKKRISPSMSTSMSTSSNNAITSPTTKIKITSSSSSKRHHRESITSPGSMRLFSPTPALTSTSTSSSSSTSTTSTNSSPRISSISRTHHDETPSSSSNNSSRELKALQSKYDALLKTTTDAAVTHGKDVDVLNAEFKNERDRYCCDRDERERRVMTMQKDLNEIQGERDEFEKMVGECEVQREALQCELESERRGCVGKDEIISGLEVQVEVLNQTNSNDKGSGGGEEIVIAKSTKSTSNSDSDSQTSNAQTIAELTLTLAETKRENQTLIDEVTELKDKLDVLGRVVEVLRGEKMELLLTHSRSHSSVSNEDETNSELKDSPKVQVLELTTQIAALENELIELATTTEITRQNSLFTQNENARLCTERDTALELEFDMRSSKRSIEIEVTALEQINTKLTSENSKLLHSIQVNTNTPSKPKTENDYINERIKRHEAQQLIPSPLKTHITTVATSSAGKSYGRGGGGGGNKKGVEAFKLTTPLKSPMGVNCNCAGGSSAGKSGCRSGAGKVEAFKLVVPELWGSGRKREREGDVEAKVKKDDSCEEMGEGKGDSPKSAKLTESEVGDRIGRGDVQGWDEDNEDAEEDGDDDEGFDSWLPLGGGDAKGKENTAAVANNSSTNNRSRDGSGGKETRDNNKGKAKEERRKSLAMKGGEGDVSCGEVKKRGLFG